MKHCNSVPPHMNSQCLRSWEAWVGIFRMRARKRKRGPDASRMCPRLARGFAILKKMAPQLSGNNFGVVVLHSLAAAAFGLPPAAGVANLPHVLILQRISLLP